MTTFAARAHVDADGKLILCAPPEYRDTDVEAHVVLQRTDELSADGWETYVRAAQRVREKWREGLSTQELIDQIRG